WPALRRMAHDEEHNAASLTVTDASSTTVTPEWSVCNTKYCRRSLRTSYCPDYRIITGPMQEFLSRVSAQLKTQIHHLPHMMMQVCGTTQENVESVACVIFASSRISLCQIAFRLRTNRSEHHLNSSIKIL